MTTTEMTIIWPAAETFMANMEIAFLTLLLFVNAFFVLKLLKK